MERENITFQTPVEKKDVSIRKWLTGSEKITISKTDKDKVLDVMLDIVLVSPKTEEVKNMHGKDFDFVVSQIMGIAEESSWSEKKN